MGSGQIGPSGRVSDSEPPEIVSEIANRVVALLTELADGALDNYFTLLGVAQLLRCKVVPDVGGGSSYCVVGAGGCRGVIRLDVSQSGDDVVRDLAHELTHHVLTVYSLEDEVDGDSAYLPALVFDRDLFEESVCRAVSQIVKALPYGLLWNGKLAPPRGDGTIRSFARLGVTVPSQSIPAEEWEELED